MIVDHIGIAVRSIPVAVDAWLSAFGYEPMTAVVTNTRQKLTVIFLRKKGSIDIKLIEPLDETSPVYQFAQRWEGASSQHAMRQRCRIAC